MTKMTRIDLLSTEMPERAETDKNRFFPFCAGHGNTGKPSTHGMTMRYRCMKIAEKKHELRIPGEIQPAGKRPIAPCDGSVIFPFT